MIGPLDTRNFLEEFAGDISVEQAWIILKDEPDSILIDVRTDAEWTFVGVPDLTSLNKAPLFVAWQNFPDMSQNVHFADLLCQAGASSNASNLFICRSGARSRAAAVAMTSEGFKRCYNVAGGFEGEKDSLGHRGSLGGWKASSLPWIQG